MTRLMKAAYLPGNRTVQIREIPIPQPVHGEVLIQTRACSICARDIRHAYREYSGARAGEQLDVVAGREPVGQIVACGPGMRRFSEGERVLLYPVSGCGLCPECRRGSMADCTSPLCSTYGRQRDGGMAPYILAEEKDLIPLPDALTFLGGAVISCAFGPAYEALERTGLSGRDTVLVVGLGPVGLAVLVLARAMGAGNLTAVDTVLERCELAREKGLADQIFVAGSHTEQYLMKLSEDLGYDLVIDCSGNLDGRRLAVAMASRRGRIVMIGEDDPVELPSAMDLLNGQKTIIGSRDASIWKVEELVRRLVRWNIRPEDLITHIFPLEHIEEAYRIMDAGKSGKVTVYFD